MKEHIKATKQTYPDHRMKIIKQFCDGDHVISEFIMEGTHKGEWIGIEPTGKRSVFNIREAERAQIAFFVGIRSYDIESDFSSPLW